MGGHLTGSEAFLGPVYKQVGSLSGGLKAPTFTSEMFEGLPCYLGLNSGRSVSRNIDKTKKHFPEKFMVRACSFPNVRSFPHGKHFFQCQFLFSRCKLCLRYTAGNFNENLSMRALAKILRAQASEHSSNFCEQFEQRQNFASTFELDGTIRHPSYLNLYLISSAIQWPR